MGEKKLVMGKKRNNLICLGLLFTVIVLGGSVISNVLKEKEYKEYFNKNSYLFLGDSRFEQMEAAVGSSENITWITGYGRDYDLYWEKRDRIEKIPKDTIVVCEWGINKFDYDGVVLALEDLCKIGFNQIYYMGIMPVDEEALAIAYPGSIEINNETIRRMNLAVETQMPSEIAFIEPFDIKIETQDGIHYTNRCYQEWFDCLVAYIGKENYEEEN